MSEIHATPGLTLKGYTKRPGSSPSQFEIQVVAVKAFNARTYMVGYTGEEHDRLSAYRADRVLSVDLEVGEVHEHDLPENAYVTGNDSAFAFVEVLEDEVSLREAAWKEFPLVASLPSADLCFIVPDAVEEADAE